MFRKDQGAYDPVISDGKHLYLTGNHSLTALRPLQRHGKAARQRAARRAKRAAQAHGRAQAGRARRRRTARLGAMATTEQAPPGLVLPEYGPTGPELIGAASARARGGGSSRRPRSSCSPSRC